MNRYLLFYGYQYYPDGGWNDFEGDYDTIEDAMDDIELAKIEEDADWYHIIDIETGVMMEYG